MEESIPLYICIATCMNVSSSSMVISSGATVCRHSEMNDVVAVPSSCDRFKSDNGEGNEELGSRSSFWTNYMYHIATILLPQTKV
jgi:hypothetical protein